MMTLKDCFIPVLAYVKKTLDGNPPDPATFRHDIVERIERSREESRRAGFDEETFNKGLFPVVAWIDETLMCANWPGALDWRKALLQKQFFNMSNAGIEFYRRVPLSTVAGQTFDRELLEVFYTVLGLGFQGQYGLNRGENDLLILKKTIQTYLEPENKLLSGKKLFPKAYPESEAESANPVRSRKKTLTEAAIWVVPPALVFLLFVLFDRLAASASHSFISRLH